MSKRKKRYQRIVQNPNNVLFDDLRKLLEDYYLSLPYTIELTPDRDGYWFAEIPLLKGCMTQGEDREEALEMIDEAKILWLETALDENIPIPEPIPQKSF